MRHPQWSKLLYPAFAESCKTANKANDGFCEDNGWNIVQAGLLAETGEIDDALELAQDVPFKKSIFYRTGHVGIL